MLEHQAKYSYFTDFLWRNRQLYHARNIFIMKRLDFNLVIRLNIKVLVLQNLTIFILCDRCWFVLLPNFRKLNSTFLHSSQCIFFPSSRVSILFFLVEATADFALAFLQCFSYFASITSFIISYCLFPFCHNKRSIICPPLNPSATQTSRSFIPTFLFYQSHELAM